MTQSTLVGDVETINEHTCTGSRVTVNTEGNLRGCRIELKQRNKLTGEESGFDDPDGRNIRGSGIRDVATQAGMVIFPKFIGGRLPTTNISVNILDA